MSHKIKANMETLHEEIEKLCKEPISSRSAERLVTYHKAYKILCEKYMRRDRDHDHGHDHSEAYKVDVLAKKDWTLLFDRKMAMDWTSGMVNADGTHGPHWTMEETDRLHKQYNLGCDKLEFWAVMNSLYSDYCEALRESSASTPEVYVRLAKAWLNDQDAVPDKAAAYYTYIVQH